MQSDVKGTALVWFRDDLRLHDHEGLNRALSKYSRVVACYVFNPVPSEVDNWGFPIVGRHRLAFLLESLQDLSSNLAALGVELRVYEGNTEIALRDIVDQEGIDVIIAQNAVVGPGVAEQKSVVAELKRVPFEFYHGQFLIHPDDLPFDKSAMPQSFSAFQSMVEIRCEPRDLIDLPDVKAVADLPRLAISKPENEEVAEVDSRTAFPFRGGETFGKYRVNNYLWDTKNVTRFRDTRNDMIGPDYSSKVSPWLANGCLSPRHVYSELKRFERKVVTNESTYWLSHELLRRDFYKHLALVRQDDFFSINGIADLPYSCSPDGDAVKSWIRGETGNDMVDANMQELARTGWMSDRGRKIVASYLCKELRQDWRIGAAWFASQLLDLDPALNWGNWMTLAGVGVDPESHVWLNPTAQAERFDFSGEYRKMWLPQPDKSQKPEATGSDTAAADVL